MSNLSTRLANLEKRTRPRRRPVWRVPIVAAPCDPELRRQAEAAGWRPSDGPYVVEVVAPKDSDLLDY